MTTNNLKEYPVNEKGEVLSYVDRWKTPILVLNEEQFLELRLETFQRGRSSAVFIWTDSQGKKYPMFVSEMVNIVQNATLINGQISGWFKVAKRGANYSLTYLRQ